jgi:hypothetical protein
LSDNTRSVALAADMALVEGHLDKLAADSRMLDRQVSNGTKALGTRPCAGVTLPLPLNPCCQPSRI